MLLNNRYEIASELGRGGFGVVFLAHDTQLHNRPVVVKVLARSLGPNQVWAEAKFRKECEALARINHPGVVTVFDQGIAGSQPFIVMQFVDGPSLRQSLTSGIPTLSQTAQYVWEIADALTAAHEQLVAHRDLKPENIMLRKLPGNRTMAVVVDFGIAGVLAEPESEEGTETVISGTPAYMAPEQLEGRPRLASDIYSFGVVVYEMVTGRRPFTFKSVLELHELQRRGQIVPPRRYRPDLREAAERAILRALSFRPEDRYAQALDLADEFIRGLRPESAAGARELLEELRKNPLEPTLHAMFGGLREPVRDFTHIAVKETPPPAQTDATAACETIETQVKLPDRLIVKTTNPGGVYTLVARGETQLLKGPAQRGPVLGVQQLPPIDISGSGRDDRDLLSVLTRLDTPGTRIQSLGSKTFNGADCLAVAVVNDTTRWSFQIYSDPATHLVIGMSRRLSKAGTNPDIEDSYSDYRPVNGALLPFQIVSRSEGKILSRTFIQRIDINAGLKDEAFDTLIASFEAEKSQMTAAEGALQKGQALLRKNQFEEAAAAFSQAATLRQDYFEAHKCLGFCYGVLGRPEPALEEYTTALRIHPADSEALYRRAVLYRLLNQPQNAIRDLTQAIEIGPDRLETYGQRAVNYRQLKEYEKAEADFSEVVRRQPGLADAYYERGMNRFLAGRHVNAIEDFTEAIRLKPHHVGSYAQRGVAFVLLKQLDRARDDLTMAVQLNPKDPEPFVCRAMVYGVLKQPALALADTNEAIRLKPNHGIAHWHRAAAREKLGDADGAAKDRAEALRLGAKPPGTR